MSRFNDEGYVAIECIDSPSEYRVARSEFKRLVEEWQGGKSFITFNTMHGLNVVLKGSRISVITDCSPEGLKEYFEMQAEEKKEAKERELTE